MGLDDMLWNFGNDLTNRGIPNYIHWDFCKLVEITEDTEEYPKDMYSPLFFMSENPVRIALIPRYK